MAIFDVHEAQRLLSKPGYDVIMVAGRDGVSNDKLIRDIETLLPANAQVRTAAEQATADKKGVSEFIDFIRYALLGFGVIALFVGAFVIFNTLSITVAQRTRELATLRTLGATRPQVLGSVVLEAFAVGLTASLDRDRGRHRPREGPDRALRGGGPRPAALGDGLRDADVGRRAAARDARHARRVDRSGDPGDARARRSRPCARARRSRAAASRVCRSRSRSGCSCSRWRCSRFGLFVPGRLGARARALARARNARAVRQRRDRLDAARHAVRARARAGRRPGSAARPGGSPAATRSAMPGRTAATAAALMVGLALVTFVTVMGKGLQASERDAVVRQIDADYVVVSQNGWTTLPAVVGKSDRERTRRAGVLEHPPRARPRARARASTSPASTRGRSTTSSTSSGRRGPPRAAVARPAATRSSGSRSPTRTGSPAAASSSSARRRGR